MEDVNPAITMSTSNQEMSFASAAFWVMTYVQHIGGPELFVAVEQPVPLLFVAVAVVQQLPGQQLRGMLLLQQLAVEWQLAVGGLPQSELA